MPYEGADLDSLNVYCTRHQSPILMSFSRIKAPGILEPRRYYIYVCSACAAEKTAYVGSTMMLNPKLVIEDC